MTRHAGAMRKGPDPSVHDLATMRWTPPGGQKSGHPERESRRASKAPPDPRLCLPASVHSTILSTRQQTCGQLGNAAQRSRRVVQVGPPNRLDSSATVPSPRTAASAAFALNSALCCFRVFAISRLPPPASRPLEAGHSLNRRSGFRGSPKELTPPLATPEATLDRVLQIVGGGIIPGA